MANDDPEGQQVEAAEWRKLRVALAERLRDLVEARNASENIVEQAQLQRRIDEIKQQVQTLVVEESVAQFVEDAERYMGAQSAMNEELLRDPDAEPA